MTDIYTSVARSAWRSGRATRMTQQIASDESWLRYLQSVRSNTLKQRDQVVLEARALTAHLARLDALIEEEKINPTQAARDVAPSPGPSDASADGASDGLPDGAQSEVAPSTTTVVDPQPPGGGPGALMSGPYARVAPELAPDPGPWPGAGPGDDAPTERMPAQEGRSAENGTPPWKS